jgi:hypothetical protein
VCAMGGREGRSRVMNVGGRGATGDLGGSAPPPGGTVEMRTRAGLLVETG